MKKIVFGLAVTALALGAIVAPSSAAAQALTADQIIAALLANPALLQQLQAMLGGSTAAPAASSFTRDLTVGSTGDDVKALQVFLNTHGAVIAATGAGSPGMESMYFGGLTKAALAKWQAANAIAPAAGYFGPKTRAAISAMGPVAPGPVTPGTTPTGITTPGVEGTLVVNQSSAGINSTVYEGDTMAPILGIEVEAKNSDLLVQRIKLDLGTTTKIYNKIYRTLYITEGGKTLAEVDLNSSTVTKESGRYYVTITGFDLLVPKNSKKVIVVKADANTSIDSLDRSAGDSTLAWGIRLETNGVRAIDGAGVNQYAGTTSVGKSITISQELAETATLDLSISASSPKAADDVAPDGASSNELDKLTLLAFDLRAKKDDVTVTDLVAQVSKVSTGGATASTTAYLFDGETELDNATVASNNTVTFSDIDYVIPKDSTKTLTLKFDIRNANGATSTISATTTASGFTAENSRGDTVTVSGSATGENHTVRNIGPVFTLLSKSITTAGVPQTNAPTNQSTSTLTATFTVRMKAVGGDIMFGGAGSTTALFANNAAADTNGTHSWVMYFNSTASSSLTNSVAATTTDYAVSSGSGIVDNGSATFTLQENATVDITVSHSFQGRMGHVSGGPMPLQAGSYSIGLERINWVNAGIKASTFMSGKTDWRTTGVSFP